MKKTYLKLGIIYIVALGINLLDAIKFPDADLNILNLIISLIMLVLIGVAAVKESSFTKVTAVLTLSSVLVFVFTVIGDRWGDISLVDILTSLKYPLYIVFTAPFFGMNYILNIQYEYFALIMGGVFMLMFLYGYYTKKAKQKK